MAKKKAKKKKRPGKDKLPPLLKGLQTARIKEMRIEKIMRVKLVNLVWDDTNALVMEGPNSQGKTSALKSFELLLAGGAMPDKPIHDGETEGSIVARFDTEVGELVVSKTFTEHEAPALQITLEGRRGKLKPEQTILEILIDAIATKPREFYELEDQAQAEMLAKIRGFDPSTMDAKRARLFEERTNVNRDAKREQAAWEQLPSHDDALKEKVVVKDLMEDLAVRQKHNLTGAVLDKAFEDASANVSAATGDVEQAERQLKEAQDSLADCKTSLEGYTADKAVAIEAVGEFEASETEEIETQIRDAEAINSKIRDNDAKVEARKTYMTTEEASEKLTAEIEAIDREKQAALLEAGKDLPVEGLELTEECVLLNGSPLSQAGQGERMLIATAVMMGVNKDSPLKLVLIDDAESMDEGTCQKLTEMIDAAGFQSFTTRVLHSSGPSEGSILIEDGTLKE